MTVSRRNLLKKIGVGTAVGLAGKTVLASEACKLLNTPKQPLGPFYPQIMPLDTNADLTLVDGRASVAQGEVILVTGIVQDQSCRPIEGAIVEIWQACKSGKYNHASDTSTNKLDPNFQYYAQVRTNRKGEYSFKTILPGAYDATTTWTRPPHIHYKISLRKYESLVTQLYFKGEKLNKYDRILQGLHKDEQDQVVVELKKYSHSPIRQAAFNVSLKEL